MRNFNPFYSFLNTHKNLVLGHIQFLKNGVGDPLQMPDGEKFTIFRHIKIKTKKKYPEAAIFRVRFQTKNMSVNVNERFSILPIPLFIGLPGFLEKYWMDNKKGFSQGIYKWSSKAYAEAYSRSFAFDFMKKRSIAGSVSFEIIEDINYEYYINSLMTKSAKI